jgi:hypothetical protein
VVNTTQSLRLEEVCDYLLNTLNEVLHGFSVEFKTALGSDQATVLETFRQLESRCEDKTGVLLSSSISRTEAELLLNCSRLCRKEFDPDEFETRLGFSLDHAKLVEDALAGLV